MTKHKLLKKARRHAGEVIAFLREHFSIVGLLLGAIFFAFSLTPSLLPRSEMVQGLISGLSLAAGYGLGVMGTWLWAILGIPSPPRRIFYGIKSFIAVVSGLLIVVFLWRADTWQNNIRELMGMDPTSGIRSLVVAIVAVLIFFLCLALARLFRKTFRYLATQLERIVPPRVSHILGLATAFLLFWAIIDGILFSLALRSADTTHRQLDALMEPEIEAPDNPYRAGGPDSLLAWEDMGRQGRRFLAGGPTREDFQDFAEQESNEVIRVYVGLNAAETPEERAGLALAELKRLGAFERSMLVLITPTGTGWVDPAGINPIEHLKRGDIASVAAQYSYLPSPVSLMAEGAYGMESARALFQAVYGHWSNLPRDDRPALYLFGLSLGALNSDRSFDFYDIIEDPFDGALWSGPPFRSPTWQDATERRNPGSPAWLPRFRDDSVIRFANQHGGLRKGATDWGDFRIAFLQYASDPITFFSPQSLYSEPDWLKSPRGPDVSKDLRWFPVVTMLQLAADMTAGTAPPGYGHTIAAEHYFDAWLALVEPRGWTESDLEILREKFSPH
ncbi:alpha/beta hydrolase [Natronospira sp.]|uniref:alpha/beta hydrolase n=1 Tax=Natronospira sp. TaxID=2024970 RepID=UPI003873489E